MKLFAFLKNLLFRKKSETTIQVHQEPCIKYIKSSKQVWLELHAGHDVKEGDARESTASHHVIVCDTCKQVFISTESSIKGRE
jgi:hypothetical protein